ncbi:MAG: PBSX family phage terminase large subunit [Alphaproteobacteria bacterium]|nr:PBSX family phage terminase large subunit [Alphaproteobacteria bacterium]
MTNNTIVKIPKIFAPLLTEKKRYKLYYGGRAGGKSYAFADSLLLLGRMKKLRIACMREVQDSIKDSVYKLLSDRIMTHKLTDYKVTATQIANKITGTTFIFKGLREQAAGNIKSLEGVDIVWLEEAQKISRHSWDILDPTIRKPESEIWISMNREQENDPVWAAVAAHPDERTLVVKVNYTDNPFCPAEMRYLAEKCRLENPDDYEHIWLGAPVSIGAYKLITYKSVHLAMSCCWRVSSAPLIIGIDVARFGDDATVMCFRRGRVCLEFKIFKHLDNVAVANQATFFIRQFRPARVFIDAGGVGGGVVDILLDRGLKRVVRPVMFGAGALMEERYHNRRAEMWDELRQWLENEQGAQLPSDELLAAELCAVNKKYDSRGRLQLEEKAEIKRRIGRSPDMADALALTFAEPVYDTDIQAESDLKPNSLESLFSTKKSDVGW